jgi:hypothetical protein
MDLIAVKMGERVMKKFAVLITALSFFTFAGCGVSYKPPAEMELSDGFAVNLPSYWEVASFKMDMSVNQGSEYTPLYKTKFHAELRLKTDTFVDSSVSALKYNNVKNQIYDLFRETLPGIIFVCKASQAGIVKTVNGVATSERYRGAWSTQFSIENDPVPALGKPLDFFQGAEVVVEGSEREQRLFAELETRINEENARKKAEIQRNEDEAKRKSDEQLAAYQKQREEEQKAFEEQSKKMQADWERLNRNDQAQMEEVQVYKLGQEPKLDTEPLDVKLYPTKVLVQSSVMAKVSLVEDVDLHTKTRDVHSSGTDRYEAGVKNYHLRILLLNPGEKAYGEMTVLVQHFVFDKPKTTTGGQIYSKEKVKPYQQKLNRIKNVNSNEKFVFDTTPIALSFSKSQFIDDAWDRTHGADDTYKKETGEQYAGFVISIFGDGKLVFQKSSSRNLRDRGVTSLDTKP